MGRSAADPATAVIGTVEIPDTGIALVEMAIQVVSAIRASRKAAEDIPLRILRLALTHLAALFLNLFPDGTVNNGLVNILEHYPRFLFL